MAKVLIIEDDLVIQKMYKRVFEFEGFEIVQAFDGKVGVELTKMVAPDMILLDIMMPVISGLQALDMIKVDPMTERIPVIVFTNLASEQDAENVLSKGAVACVHKSQVDPKQVVQMVRDELSRREVMVPEKGMRVVNS